MVYILLNWLYILVTTFLTGFAVLHLIEKYFGYHVKRIDAYIVAGLVILTTYAQWFSIFYRVNWEANLILILFDLAVLLLWGRQVTKVCTDAWKRTGWASKIVIAVLVIMISYFTSRGNFISDTNLYHAQAIRWIEEYGALKGLANVQSRAAYNSSSFCLSALYSMKYVFGQSMHAVQGFMALVLACVCTEIGHVFGIKEKVYGALGKMKQLKEEEKHNSVLRRKPKLSDFAILGAIYYLTLLHDEIMSPSSDYAVMIIIFYVIIRWLNLLEEKETSEVPYSLLCVVGAYTVTLKLTAGLILLLLVKPVYLLIKRKKWNEIIMYLLMGIVVAAPFFIRNIVISGYLIYPLTAIDLFQVDWKVPQQIVDADAFQIKSWGKGIHEYGMYNTGPVTWLPNWFKTVPTATEKAMILGDAVAVIVLLVQFGRQCQAWGAMGKGKALAGTTGKSGKSLNVESMGSGAEQRAQLNARWDVLLVMGTVAASYLYWQFSAPLTRYGYAYILLLLLLVFGDLYIKLSLKVKETLFFILLAVFFLWKSVVLVQGAWSVRLLDAYVSQTDYDTNEGDDYVKPFEINGITFYYGVAGYHKLPGGNIGFTMRSEDIRDGFVYADRNEIDVFGKKVRE